MSRRSQRRDPRGSASSPPHPIGDERAAESGWGSACHPMSLYVTLWHSSTGPPLRALFVTPATCSVSVSASEAGGRAFAGEQGSPSACDCVGRESRPGHHFLCSSNFWVDRSQKARSAGARFSLRTFAANRARVTIYFRALGRLASASVAHRITESPNQTEPA